MLPCLVALLCSGFLTVSANDHITPTFSLLHRPCTRLGRISSRPDSQKDPPEHDVLIVRGRSLCGEFLTSWQLIVARCLAGCPLVHLAHPHRICGGARHRRLYGRARVGRDCAETRAVTTVHCTRGRLVGRSCTLGAAGVPL
ncbi:hypothetical protein B0H10DRAFT_2056937 [Mycena sp. CBHHK59/15]|nr:hypothetical protein B0H10DRAFT_2056937 [Mycena sp. CBHHK59/15]